MSFRHLADPYQSAEDIGHRQDDDTFLSEIFGIENDDSVNGAIQDIGSVETREGRVLTFPNIFQHRVEPFSLTDRTKPGHRKIVALFLVDPHVRIISTANVPCQQKEWWAEEVARKRLLPKLPIELQLQIASDARTDFPIDMEDAKALREELMRERSVHTDGITKAWQRHKFNLCEH